MSTQNRYNISFVHKAKEQAQYGDAWTDSSIIWTGNTWQAACQKWIAEMMKQHEVLSETPSEDSRSGIMEIKEPMPHGWDNYCVFWKIKANIID